MLSLGEQAPYQYRKIPQVVVQTSLLTGSPKKQVNSKLGVPLLVIGILASASFPLFVKYLTEKSVPVLNQGNWKSCQMTLLLLPAILWEWKNYKANYNSNILKNKQTILTLTVCSMLNLTRYVSLFYALYLSSISRVWILANTQIFFYAIIRIIKKEFMMQEIIGFALIGTGILIIFIESELNSENLLNTNSGNLLALLSSLISALHFELNTKFRLSHFPFLLGTLIKTLILFIFLLIISIAESHSSAPQKSVIGWTDGTFIWIVLIWTIACGWIGTLLPLASLQLIEPMKYTNWIIFEPVFTIILSFIWQLEAFNIIILFSTILFILGYLWILRKSIYSETQVLQREQDIRLFAIQRGQEYIEVGINASVDESVISFEINSERGNSFRQNQLNFSQQSSRLSEVNYERQMEELKKQNEEEDDNNSLTIIQKAIKYNKQKFLNHLELIQSQLNQENLQQFEQTKKKIQNNMIYQQNEEIAKYIMLLEVQGDWELLHSSQSQNLYSKKSTFFNDNFLISKTVMDLEQDFPISLIPKLFYEESERSKWDENTTRQKVLKQISQHEFIGYAVNKSPIPFMSDRDFVDRYIVIQEDDVMIMFASSCKFPECPPVQKFTRADCIITANIVRRVENQVGITVILTMMQQSDIKFKVPQDLIKKVYPSTMKAWYQKFKKCVNDYISQSPENNA